MRKTLPPAALAAMRDSSGIALNAARGPLLVVLTHGRNCPECRAFVDSLAGYREQFAEWGARVFVSVSEHAPAIFVADEWGEVYFESAAGHAFTSPDEILEWLRFVAIQCPECEQPEGPWKDL